MCFWRLTTVSTSVFTGSLVVEVVFVSLTTTVVECLALLVVRVEVPLLKILRAASVKRCHVTGGHNISAKLFALFESLKVVLVSVTAGVGELAANSVPSVKVVPAGLFATRSGSVWKHTSVALLGDRWACSRSFPSVVLAWRFLRSWWLGSWTFNFLSGTTSLAVFFGSEAVLVTTAASVVELSAALNLSIEIPIGHIGLAIADIGWQLASVLD